MHRLILSTFLFILLLNQSATASPTALTPFLILQSFPLCNISSSLGQKCKSLSENERVNFAPSNITDAAPDFINEERLEIVTDDWNYSFILETTFSNTATVEFIDDAKFATYFAATKYYLEWNSKIQKWVIVGEKVTYISGSAEDKKIEGKYFALSSPITLLEK